MRGLLSEVFGAVPMSGWAFNAVVGVVVVLLAVRGLVWLYCMVITIRTAIGADDKRGDRALKVLDRLLRWIPFRRYRP